MLISQVNLTLNLRKGGMMKTLAFDVYGTLINTSGVFQRLQQLVEQQPDATIKELQQRLGLDCCESAVGEALKRLGLTFKKRRSMPPNRIDRTSRTIEKHGRIINR